MTISELGVRVRHVRPMSTVAEPELWAAITISATEAAHYGGPDPSTRNIARRLSTIGSAVDLDALELRLYELHRDGLLARRPSTDFSHWRVTSAGVARAAELRARDLTDAEAWPAVNTHLADRATLGAHHLDGVSAAALARALAVDTRQVLAWLTVQATRGLVVQGTVYDRPAWLITAAGRTAAAQPRELVSA